MGFIGGGPANLAPTASWTYGCNASLLCTFDGTSSADPDGSVVSWTWTGPGGQGFGTGAVVTRQFTRSQTGTLTLTVTDDDGATDAETKTIVIQPPAGNAPPVANFTFSCNASRLCMFDGTSSTDSDGTVVTWTWKWQAGNRTFGTGSVLNKQFPGPGTATVILEVTYDDGATATITRTIVVP